MRPLKCCRPASLTSESFRLTSVTSVNPAACSSPNLATTRSCSHTGSAGCVWTLAPSPSKYSNRVCCRYTRQPTGKQTNARATSSVTANRQPGGRPYVLLPRQPRRCRQKVGFLILARARLPHRSVRPGLPRQVSRISAERKVRSRFLRLGRGIYRLPRAV